MKRLGLILATLCSLPALASGARAAEALANDYPTVARADYVFGCMAVNGQTRDALQKCSCSIDAIASILPFAQYEQAETIMSVIQKGGEAVTMFHTHKPFVEMVNNLKRAQIEGELRCF